MLALLLKRFHLNFHECFDFGSVALAVRTRNRDLTSSLALLFPRVYDALSELSSCPAEQ